MIATSTTATCHLYGPKKATIRRTVAARRSLRDGLEVLRGRRETPRPGTAAGHGSDAAAAKGHEQGGRRYQAVAVDASAMPSDSSQRSASIAALQPSPAAVTAWR